MQYDFGTIDPQPTTGTQLAALLGAFRDAVNSLHKGVSRPSYAVDGMMWVKETVPNPTLMMFDGTDDRPLATITDQGCVAVNADKLDGLQSNQLMRSDINTIFSGLMLARRPADEQIRFGDSLNLRPLISFYNLLERKGFIQSREDEMRIAVVTESEEKLLQLKDNGEILWDGKIVRVAGADGAGSDIDADLLDGQHGAYYRNVSNFNAGTLAIARLPVASAVEAQVGSSASKLMTPQRTEEAISALSFGRSTTLVDETANRFSGTNYQNTLDRPLGIALTDLLDNSSATSFLVGPDPANYVRVAQTGEFGAYIQCAFAIVPPDYWYRLDGGTAGSWVEYT
ncbi:hypothetical protein [uncultured Tateyamaria sp.]|uniref:hypothetical protein n=1 Tax=Tateyamaria sp. 1078 TaxID=3417464 RepID=UPI0026184176|nr:hypothetical protein [uncultured Tateyamaria sp.]